MSSFPKVIMLLLDLFLPHVLVYPCRAKLSSKIATATLEQEETLLPLTTPKSPAGLARNKAIGPAATSATTTLALTSGPLLTRKPSRN
mgnify:CR=1 FL=1